MKFARAIWKLLVGIKDGLVLLLLILFFTGLYGALSARPAPIGRACSTSTSTAASSSSRPPRMVRRRRFVPGPAVSAARSRHRARQGQGRQPDQGGCTRSRRLHRRRRDRGRRSRGGRPSGARRGQAGDRLRRRLHRRRLALASAASEIWLNPLGGVLISGPGGSNLYYKGLLDKLGVTANVYRVGTYKSAVEPYIRNDMSPEARAELHGARPGSARNLEAGSQAGAARKPTSTSSSAT